MKELLVISHPCANPINQEFFAQVEKITGWNITLVIPANWCDEYGNLLLPGASPAFNGKLIPVPVLLPGNIPLHFYRIDFARLLRALRPDAIYVHHEAYAAATAQVFFANRATLRCPIGFYSAQNILKRYPVPFSLCERLVYHWAAFALPVSESVGRILGEKGFRGEARVLPLAIDPDLYTPEARDPQLHRSLGGDAGVPVIGYLGRLAREKGLATLLAALTRLGDLPWKLAVVGAGPFEEEFDRLVQSLGLGERVVRVGYVPHREAPRYLASFDLLVLPSETQVNWKEQFGRVLVEALACGTPVLGSNSGEIPLVIEATGGGSVFAEGDAAALAAQLRPLIVDADLRRSLAEAGRQVAITGYTQAVLAERFAQVVAAAT